MKLLSGYRVIELGDPAAMFAGKLLGDMGCDVLRIERPHGDPWRTLAPLVPWGTEKLSATWVAYNTSKRSVLLDVEAAAGRQLFERLVDTADMVVISARPEWMRQHRLLPSDLRSSRRKLVAVAITPFGVEGPKSGFKGADIVMQAAGGMLFLNGDADRPPVRISEETSWAQTGSQTAYVATAALYSAQRDGVGESIDISAQETIVAALMNILPWWQHAGKNVQRGAEGDGLAIIPNVLRCKDGYVCYRMYVGKGVGERSKVLVDWMVEEGMDEGLRDVPWESMSSLKISQEEVDSITGRMEKFFLSKTRAELYAGALKRKILMMPVMELADVSADPQMIERGFFKTLSDSSGRGVRFPGPLFRVASSAPEGIDNPSPSAPPVPGQHTADVLAELAGVDAARFKDLRSEGVVA